MHHMISNKLSSLQPKIS